MWARRQVWLSECPKPYISADSIAWLEAFAAWKLLGGIPLESMPARQADAFRILEKEWRAEETYGEK